MNGMSFGQRMREQRKALGISRTELAQRLGVSPSAIGNYEQDTSFPKEPVLLRLFDCLETDPNTLFQDHFLRGETVLSDRERELLKHYRSLSALGKEAIGSVVTAMCAYRDDLEAMPTEPEPRVIPLYRSPAAAGYAAPVFGEDFDYIQVDETVPQAAEFAVRIQGELPAIKEERITDGRVRYDFGRNFAGRFRIRVRGKRGQQVVITPGELLKEDGTINQEFTGGPHYYEYTLAGEGEEEWMPRFTYYGQRYALIETEAEILSVTGQEQYADCPQTGSFSCSNEMYNSIHRLIVGAVKSNMQSVFTDCPHREKLGWLEETHLIGPGILDNFDARALYEKILDDMEDSRTPEGLVPSISPEYVQFDLGFRDSPEWGSACVLVPWYLYQRYGDISILSRRFAVADRYARYLLSKRNKAGILNYGLGDWLDVGHYPSHPANTTIPVPATAILYQDLTVMARMAEILGRIPEKEWYESRAAECAEAFNEAFFYPLSGNYGTGSQTSNAMPLFLDLPEEKERARVIRNLKADIAMHDGHFTGGDVGHPYILRALAKCGLSDIIAENLMKTDFPSYGYQVACGATTLCEDWDGPNPEHPVMSQNHFMLGGAEEWFYGSLAGIRVDASLPEKIRICPCFVKEVDWVEAGTLTPAGTCRVRWEREGEQILVTVSLERKERILLCLGETEEVLELEGTVERRIWERKR